MTGFFLFLLGLFFVPLITDVQYRQADDSDHYKIAVKEIESEIYADSVMKTLSLDEKIAQLIMLDVYPNKNESYYKTVDTWVKDKKIGGIIFFRGQPAEIASLSYRYSSKASIPLWVAMDAEWGISMRVDSIRRLPYAMTLGAITDNSLIREYGQIVAIQCRRMGVNMNMAPVADVNNNPKNPVINYRSFGENPYNVAAKAISYFLGQNDNGVISVGKHFPGHGNTDADSHHELPVITDSWDIIDSIHLLPFKELMKYGLQGIMTAHLSIPEIDPALNLPSSLSSVIINGILLKQMGFSGFVITDALGMQGASDHFKPGQIEVNALIAGNDILLMPKNPQITIDSVRAAIKDGRINESLINDKCRKLLKLKYLYLFDSQIQDKFSGIPAELNNEQTSDFIFRVFSNAITLVANRDSILPFAETEKQITVVSIGKQSETVFVKTLKDFYQVNHITTNINPVEMEVNKAVSAAGNSEKVIVCLYGMNNSAGKNYGISDAASNLIQKLSQKTNVVLVLFGNPYGLNYLSELKSLKGIVVAYEEQNESETAAAMCIAGIQPFKGVLPVSAGGFLPGTGTVTTLPKGMESVDPAEMGLDLSALKDIDVLVEDAIAKGAFPGCQIVLAYKGKVFYNKSFGFHTYDQVTPVLNSDVYDLASLTKVLATTAAIMKLFDEGKIKLDDPLNKHLDMAKDAPAANLTINEIMAHQSGLISWIPFYKKIIENDSIRNLYFSQQMTSDFSIPVAENLWMLNTYTDSIFGRIFKAELKRKRYKYSDLGFYLLKELVESVTGEPFEKYLTDNFYKPMHLQTMIFNPLRKFDVGKVVPTENDTLFRKQVIRGYVHDPGAAMLGGVSGHAGLFANALDVAAMMQMFLDYGVYNGFRYLDSMTVVKFCSKQYSGNRRGLGFDRPDSNPDNGNTCTQASAISFGHTGFTGTFAWADPQHGLVVVFLSNRVYPDAGNSLLSTMKIRKKVQEYAYKAIHIQ